MNKIVVYAVVLSAAILTGCQTRVMAEKHPEQVLPITEKVTVNGEDQLITTHYQIASGGWYATARSPIYAAEALEGLDLGVHTNGSVTLSLGKYNRDLSTNSVVMVKEMFSGGAQLAIAIGDAYTKIAGGGAQAATLTSVVAKAYSLFTSSGGDASKATVTTVGDTLKVSDGTTCVTCDKAGNCTSGNCSTGTCTTGNCSD